LVLVLKKYGGLGLGLETQSLGLGLGLDKKVLFTSLLSTQLPFVNDAVYIILTELLFNAIAIARLEIGMEYPTLILIDHCGVINE